LNIYKISYFSKSHFYKGDCEDDKMAENMNKESEITSTVEDTWFVNIPEVEIKLENAKIQGKLYNFVNLLLQL